MGSMFQTIQVSALGHRASGVGSTNVGSERKAKGCKGFEVKGLCLDHSWVLCSEHKVNFTDNIRFAGFRRCYAVRC